LEGIRGNLGLTPNLGERFGDAKSRLRRSAHLLLGRMLVQEDVVFVTVEGNSQWIASVNLPSYDGELWHRGSPKRYKDQAETSAAEVALEALANEISEAEALRSQELAGDYFTVEKEECADEEYANDDAEDEDAQDEDFDRDFV
jgi:hypothetical protein